MLLTQTADVLLRELPIVPVVVDPIIGRKLRPHQIEGNSVHQTHLTPEVDRGYSGVKFLYECVMGLRKHEGQGCILADEMCGSHSSCVIVC